MSPGKRIAAIATVIVALACASAFALALVRPPEPPLSESGAAQAALPSRSSAEPAVGNSRVTSAGEGSTGAVGSAARADGGTDDSALADDPVAYEPGYVLATLGSGATSGELRDALDASPELAGIAISGQVGTHVVKLSLPEGLGVARAVELLEPVAAVESAQPNYRYYTQQSAAAPAADPVAQSAAVTTAGLVAGTALGNALGIQSVTVDDPLYGDQWYLPSINASQAWDSIESRNLGSPASPVTVAILDADFNPAHSDLSGNVIGGYDVSTNQSFSSPWPFNIMNASHGTHVAGVVGARANNSQLIAGLTCNMVRVLPVRVGDKDGIIETSDLAQAYSYLAGHAAEYNIRVANVSLGAGSPTEVQESTDEVLYRAIAQAHAAGIVTVAAACNSDDEFNPPFYAYPSDFDNVVSVINLTESLARDSSSNYNKGSQKQKDISAPGEDILSLSASPFSSTEKMSGTSMASPVVAGALGLVFTADPSLTADEATSKLFSTAHDLDTAGWDVSTGYGEVDVAAAVGENAPYLSGSPVINGSTAFTVKVNGVAQNAAEWAWTSSDPSIARPNSAGVVYGSKKGQAIVTATKDGMSASQTVNVVTIAAGDDFKVPVSELTVKIQAQTYSGKALTPEPDVYDGATKLAKGVNYTVTYSKNVNAGTGKAIIKGLAPYDGSVVKSFTIQKADLGEAKVKLSATSLSYSGKKLKPSATVKDIGVNAGVKLKSGKDFKLSGAGVKLGSGTITLTAKAACANFTGSVTKAYTVKVVKKKVYALYNKGTKQWFYTAKPSERKALKAAGWLDKGVAWKAPSKSTKPVYRLAQAGRYRYTVSKTYRPKGWAYEGVAFYSYEKKKGHPVYRYYNAKTKAYRYVKAKLKSSAYKRKPTRFYSL